MSNLAKIGELYTPLSEAIAQLEHRRKDSALRSRSDAFFASHPSPKPLGSEPRFVMSPAVTTPNLEFIHFMDLREHLPLSTVFFEYAEDKFVLLNQQKRALGDMTFFRKGPRHEIIVTGIRRILDFETEQGRPMSDVVTFSGEDLITFHHRLLRAYFPGRTFDIVDFSAWFRGSYAFSPEFRYLRFLGLFITDAILFANFTTEKHETAFTHKHVLPAFRELKRIFGIAPLIVPAQPAEHDEEAHWCYYPEEIRSLI